MSEYKKYDSDDKYINWHARLAKDAEVRDTGRGKMVRLTFASTSRAESDEDLWITATPNDRQAEIATYLKKGDVIGIEGKPTVRKGKEGDKTFFNLRYCELHLNHLIGTLKERGFVPGGKAESPKQGNTTPAKKVLKLDDE